MSGRRTARRPSPPKPLDPKDFVQRVAAELGTEPAKRLVGTAFKIVERSGQPNRWIFEVKRARERGVINLALAHFLIFKFAESAMMQLVDRDPLLSSLNGQLERIEREHGLTEDEAWNVNEGPPEWQALNREWDTRYDEILLDIFLRNGELEIAETYAADDETVFEEGRAMVFGELPK